ncbi:MAG: chromate resistance protein [Candidatus Latescibacteria bacterium]|nr:chromate resistance protein [Candidatus Latescibacterota bacterium]
MRWVTRHEPHVDRCASIWLIRTLIDPEAVFDFISRDSPVPAGAIPFTLPGADLQPTETSTTFDALVKKYQLADPVVVLIAEILRDFEIQAGEDLERVKMKESAGVYYVLRGLARTSKSDAEIVYKAMMVMDALYAELKARMEAQ